MQNRSLSPQHRKSISLGRMGLTQTLHQKHIASITHKGKTLSSQTRSKISDRMKIISAGLKSCPHCNIVGSGPVMKRWHFDHCKLKQ